MKKLKNISPAHIKSLLLIPCIFLTTFLKAEIHPEGRLKNETNINYFFPGYTKKIYEGGFYIHPEVMLPAKNYFMPKGMSDKTIERFNIGAGLEIGNIFQLVEYKNYTSWGLRFTLLNVMYTSNSKDGKILSRILQGSAFDFGPCFNIGLDKLNALIIYYQLCPTYMYNTEDSAAYAASGAFGLNHEFGLNYRFKFLSIGIVYNFGKVKYIDATTNDKFMKPRLDHFRFFVGIMI